MPKSQSFSETVDLFLQTIRPYGRSESAYPRNLLDSESRRGSRESCRDWFSRIVNRFCSGDPTLFAIENNLGVFARFGWQGSKQPKLIYANIQTIHTACTLEDYFLGEEASAVYLRLDFDYLSLGGLFSHPLAHVHFGDELSPRFALEGGENGNIVLDYLELLYRTYAHPRWVEWVQREWLKETSAAPNPTAPNPLQDILQAFAENQFALLRNFASELTRLKNILRKRKDVLFDLHVNGQDRLLLEYPLSR